MMSINSPQEDRSETTCSGMQSRMEELQCQPELGYQRPYKIALAGDCGVGKTSLACRLCNPDWKFQPVKTTVGVDYKQRIMKVDDQIVKLHLCDTQGEEKFGRVTTSFYRVAHVVFLVFDVTRYQTFQDIIHWVDDVLTYQRSEAVVKFLIGNKSDKNTGREVDAHTAKEFARHQGIQYIETSAISGNNLETLLEGVCRTLLGYSCAATSQSGRAAPGASKTSTSSIRSQSSKATLGTRSDPFDRDELDGSFRLEAGADRKKEKGTCLSC